MLERREFQTDNVRLRRATGDENGVRRKLISAWKVL
jgi:hypothetical protein